MGEVVKLERMGYSPAHLLAVLGRKTPVLFCFFFVYLFVRFVSRSVSVPSCDTSKTRKKNQCVTSGKQEPSRYVVQLLHTYIVIVEQVVVKATK